MIQLRTMAVMSLVLSLACGRDSAIVIGSKNFTEQNVLGEIVAQTLEDEGFRVERRFHLGGTFVCHRALVDDAIDLYVEYTGTASAAILEQPTVTDPETVLALVRREYARHWDLSWLDPLGFDNTFALVVRNSDAERYGLRTISDLSRVAPDLTAGFGPEFMARADGYGGLKQTYELEFGTIRQLDLGLMYRALQDLEIDVAVGNSTDGQIAGLDLLVLDDDREYFPPYEAAIVVRSRILVEHPDLESALRSLSGAVDDRSMRAMNHRVDVRGEDVRRVVREWRVENLAVRGDA